jgi:hypothetical protein
LFSSTPISHLSLSVKLLLLSDLVQEKLLWMSKFAFTFLIFF